MTFSGFLFFILFLSEKSCCLFRKFFFSCYTPLSIIFRKSAPFYQNCQFVWCWGKLFPETPSLHLQLKIPYALKRLWVRKNSSDPKSYLKFADLMISMIVARKAPKGLSIRSNIFCKTNIAYTSAYQGSRNVSFRENFAIVTCIWMIPKLT